MRILLAGLAVAGAVLVARTPAALPAPRPLLGGYEQLTTSPAPPTEAQCRSASRRCFTPSAIESAYDLAPLYRAGAGGTGQTIAIIDAYGNPTMAHDLHVFDHAFGLQPMCGEQDVTCAAGMPTFTVKDVGGSGGDDDDSWALETALDVESAHAIAPQANILLVTTPSSGSSPEQGFPQLMDAAQYVIDHHLANVITQSFGATEQSLGAPAITRLRQVYADAQAAGVTVLASSGDSGAAGGADWPASDPLVTAVGGTNLCTDPQAALTAPRAYASGVPSECAGGQPESAWSGSGGGYSQVFGVPPWQPATQTGRGVPDVALQASPTTGALVYISLAPEGDGGLMCGSTPCSSGWYDVGGTSLASPQWAGLVAIADQLNGGGLGLLNPSLYAIAADPTLYARDFYDVTSGANTASGSAGGYDAAPGWDPVTGLGTPNAAALVPDLVAAAHAA